MIRNGRALSVVKMASTGTSVTGVQSAAFMKKFKKS